MNDRLSAALAYAPDTAFNADQLGRKRKHAIKHRENLRHRRLTDMGYRMQCICRSRMRNAMLGTGQRASFKLVGCSRCAVAASRLG